ncbi:hypothetical protein ACFQ1L_13685 [Phytohabitans flavus]|uniref:hypothetical protein n=1 Tax=Phytohabitans flavus TaxID=1076124 RepID=UPI003637DC16
MDRDRYAAELLQPLVREPAGPSQVDIAQAIADGERRRRTVRLVSAGGAAAVTVLALVAVWTIARPAQEAAPFGGVTPPLPDPAAEATGTPSAAATVPAPPASCTVRRLPMPAGHPAKSIVTGGDPTGRYIVGRSYPKGGRSDRILIWDRGKVSTATMTGADPQLSDVTSTGVAVGSSFVNSEDLVTAAWVYRNGKITRMPGEDAEARAINEREVVVGSVNGRPAMWRSPTSQPTMLATPDGSGWQGWAAAVGEDGTIVGRLSRGNSWDQAYLWRPDGTLEALPKPTMNGKPATTYTADAIRNGWVAGWSALDEGATRHLAAPRWHLPTGELDMIDRSVIVNAVNRNGWVVAETDEASLVAGDRYVRLPGLHDAVSLRAVIPYTISDDGATAAGQAS